MSASTAHDTNVGTSNGAGISEVMFFLLQGATVVRQHQELGASYDWSLDAAGVATGSYTLRATATATAGGSNSTEITVHIIGNQGSVGNGSVDGAEHDFFEAWAITNSWSLDPAGVTYPDFFYCDWVRAYLRQ